MILLVHFVEISKFVSDRSAFSQYGSENNRSTHSIFFSKPDCRSLSTFMLVSHVFTIIVLIFPTIKLSEFENWNLLRKF